jgi:hypothetical protein
MCHFVKVLALVLAATFTVGVSTPADAGGASANKAPRDRCC